eukprot:CAMPEP_0182875768 /NCGR_PEP_ID=MMETSP0034_2-20130328/13741_1 /TAXON_ID=156128 /ORGANISM="Nephroselmis pyriformis, Strain CCMP717" /LENGTH=292 /DNA_ID=CAMNT_0025008523 /DNA_START=148 /DNA_END=1023 /DNA_ORIENTATION=-
MFETDRLTPTHVARCNAMNEVWVPTAFHVGTFAKAGVDPAKLRAVPEPVDVDFFDPEKYEPLDLPWLLGADSGRAAKRVFRSPRAAGRKGCALVSIFKWEERKGWDFLLKAFLSEFSGDDDVALVMLTNPYHGTSNFVEQMKTWARENMGPPPEGGWPEVLVIDKHLPTAVLPRLYKAARAFVLPSRGEGWGRPNVEAMSMGVPVIATNWSGPTAYLTEENGYPLRVEGLDTIQEGFMEGHQWARPSAAHLRELMRLAFSDPAGAAARGKLARRDMVAKYSPDAVGRVVVRE